MELLNKQSYSEIYVLDEVTVLKKDFKEREKTVAEYCIANNIIFNHVANYKRIFEDDQKVFCIEKERIEYSDEIKEKILSLLKDWDDKSSTIYSMFDYFNGILERENSNIAMDRNIINFINVCEKEMKPYFLNFISMLKELKKHKIIKVDFHVENFGLKNNVLCLFELGGSKIKE